MEISLTIQKIKNRDMVFIGICLFIAIISWYYVSCFNNVYPYTKIEWIKSSIVIIIGNQLLPIPMGLLETSLRFLSFKYKSEKVFKLSKLFS